MNQIKRRVESIEKKLRVAAKGETLEQQLKAFDKGEYGMTIMNIVVNHVNSRKLEGSMESLKGLPSPLREYFQDLLRNIGNRNVTEND